MSVTTKPQDKFAFLFSGPTDDRYKSDLVNVYNTLTEFYNYPKNHVWVLWGGEDDLSSLFTGAKFKSINAETDPKAVLILQFKAFSDAVEANTPFADPLISSPKNAAVIFFTGIGLEADPVDPMDHPKIVVRPAGTNTEVLIDSLELKTLMKYKTFSQSQINLVLQHDFSNLFTSDMYTNGIISVDKTVTNVNGDQAAKGDSTGGNFTKGWIAGLRQIETVLVGGLDKYADELPYTSEPYLVSMEQAKEFAQIKNAPETYSFQSLGELPFLGKPEFMIQDGDDSTVGWWESPDLYLTHPKDTLHPDKKDDLFLTDPVGTTTDFNNVINVVFRNIGTHPIRRYRLGVKVYRSPFDIDKDAIDLVSHKPADLVLKPTNLASYNNFSNANKETVQWPTAFLTGTTHLCLWAKVEFPSAAAFNWDWNVLVNVNEAQRNTDPGSDPPKDDKKPRPGDHFRGNKKHKYFIHNPFRETHQFMITTLPEYHKSMSSASMSWYSADENSKWKRMKFANIEKGFGGYEFTLKGREVKSILGEFGFKPGSKVKKLRLPVEILVDKKSGANSRKPLASALGDKFSAIAGLTIIMTYEPADITCRVIDKKLNPVPEALIHIETINGLQEETLHVNKNGELVLKSINPDVYRIKASLKNTKSNEVILQLSGGDSAKVNLEINVPKQKTDKKKK